MRQSIYIGCLLFTLASLVSCKKFLEQPPYNNISVQDIFKDFEGARTTLVGCYDALKSSAYYLKDFYVYPEVTGGNIKYSRPANLQLIQSYNFNNDPLNNDMLAFYRTAYSTIYNCNNILRFIDQATDATPAQKARMLADAYAIRALVHFDLMRVFAQPYNFTSDASHEGIILMTANRSVTDPTGTPQSAKQVFTQIVTDLDSAIALYQRSVFIYTAGVEKTWLSVEATKALLSRVTLYMQDWTRTISLATEIIASNKYTLIPNSAYVSSWSRKNISNESIFELAYGSRIGGSLGDYYNLTNAQYGQLAATTDLLNLYSPGDVRGAPSMFSTLNINGLPFNFTRKYQGMNDSANNIKVIRLSEVYLNRAEAYAEARNLTAALADLNVIRKRANPAAANFVSTDKQAVIDEILVERSRELAFEGHTFFDLARKKKNIARADCSATTCSLTYPNAKYAVPKPAIQ